MLGHDRIRTEYDAIQETKERRYLSWGFLKNDWDIVPQSAFKTKSIRQLYSLLSVNSDAQHLENWLTPTNMTKIWFNDAEKDQNNSAKNGNFMFNGFFDEVINTFGIDYDLLYRTEKGDRRGLARKQLKRLLVMIGNIVRGEYILTAPIMFEQEYKKWKKEIKN
jgi:hypothetical protein